MQTELHINKIVRIENLINIHLANKRHLVLLLSGTKNAFVKIIPSLNTCIFSGRAQSVHEPQTDKVFSFCVPKALLHTSHRELSYTQVIHVWMSIVNLPISVQRFQTEIHSKSKGSERCSKAQNWQYVSHVLGHNSESSGLCATKPTNYPLSFLLAASWWVCIFSDPLT